jgi:nucleoside-diphosphate-sugar epimerase
VPKKTAKTATTVGITGAGGFLGGSLATLLRESGTKVIEYRRDTPSGGTDVRVLELGGEYPKGTFAGVTCVVHTAWDLKETNRRRNWEVNVEGSKRLIAAALEEGVGRVIFVSSMSAYFGTKQEYGLAKLAVERTVLEAHQVVVRPGLVYGSVPGEVSGGMSLTLSRLARLPVIPVFRNARLFTVNVNDVVGALQTLATALEVPSAVIGLAQGTSTSFSDIMRAIADEVDSTSRMVPVPWHPLLLTLRVAERCGVTLPVRSDSLLGLVRSADTVPGMDVARELGLTFRLFPDGLSESFDPA